MSIGCDPASHPTATWIHEHIEEYTDNNNPWIAISGGTSCSTNDDCTIAELDFITRNLCEK